jgi:hypothetical protein
MALLLSALRATPGLVETASRAAGTGLLLSGSRLLSSASHTGQGATPMPSKATKRESHRATPKIVVAADGPDTVHAVDPAPSHHDPLAVIRDFNSYRKPRNSFGF